MFELKTTQQLDICINLSYEVFIDKPLFLLYYRLMSIHNKKHLNSFFLNKIR